MTYTKISELPPTSVVNDADLLIINDGNITSNITHGILKINVGDYVQANTNIFTQVNQFNNETLFANSIKVGGSLPNNPYITLTNLGYASFFGNVDSGNPTNSLQTGVRLFASGQLYVRNQDDNTAVLLLQNGTDNALRVLGDGSAEFSGDVGIGGTLPNSPNIDLNADGTAYLATSLGIGVTTPSSTLHVSAADPAIRITDSDTGGSFELKNVSNVAHISNYANAAMVFSTNTTERMRIDEDGNVGIGTNNPQVELDVVGDFDITGLISAYGDFTIKDGFDSPVVTLRVDGTADFEGTVKIGGSLPSSPNITLNEDGSIVVSADALINSLTVGLGDGGVTSNTAIGNGALQSNTTGSENTSTGYQSLYLNTEGNNNTANGYQALYTNTTGSGNTATGRESLRGNTTGTSNVANGYASLYTNTTGFENTATGRESLRGNTTGSSNAAHGYRALYSNTEGNSNTANGYRALYNNIDGDNNTSTGRDTLYLNTTGNNNTAIGYLSLNSNTTGSANTSIGRGSLRNNTIGNNNTVIGEGSGNYIEGSNNTVIGAYEGIASDASLSNTIIISAGANEKLRIDNSGSLLFGGTLPSSPNIILNDDGSASFNGNVGIGTNNPGRELHVVGSSNVIRAESTGSAARIEFEDTNTTGVGVVSLGSVTDDMQFVAGGTERMRIDSAGNVGMGTNDPLARLQVVGDILLGPTNATMISSSNYLGTQITPDFQISSEVNSNPSISLTNTRSNSLGSGCFIFNKANGNLAAPTALGDSQTIGAMVFNGYDGSSYVRAAQIQSIVDGTVNTGVMPGTLTFSTSATGSSNPKERMRIDAAGNVGIGTISPSAPLMFGKSVFGDNTSEDFYRIKLEEQGGISNDVGFGQPETNVIGYNAKFGHRFYIGQNGEAMRIDSSGNVGIGTSDPETNLQIDDVTPELRINSTDGTLRRMSFSGPGSNIWYLKSFGVDATYNNSFEIAQGSDSRLFLQSGGNVGIGTSNPNSRLNVVGTDVNSNIGRIVNIDDDTPAARGVGGSIAFRADIDGTQRVLGVVKGFQDNDNPAVFDGGLAFETRTNGESTTRERMRIARNGMVGIGTDDPESPLHVASSANWNFPNATLQRITSNNTSPSFLQFALGGDNGDVNVSAEHAYIGLKLDSTPTATDTVNGLNAYMRFYAPAGVLIPNGNVGIGTDSPQTRLHVKGGFTTKIRLESTAFGRTTFDPEDASIDLAANGMNTTSKYTPSINFGSSDANFTTTNPKFGAAINAASVQSYTTDDGGGMDLNFWTSPGSPGTGHGLVQRMVIASSGEVGIATDTPGQLLTVQTDTNPDPGNSAGRLKGTINLQNNGGTEGQDELGNAISFSRINTTRRGALISSYQPTTDNSQCGLAFYTKGSTTVATDAVSQRVVIDHNGNVGIGTTDPSADLQVGDYTTEGVRFYKTGYAQVRSDAGSGGFECYQNGSTSTERTVRITTAGNATFSGTINTLTIGLGAGSVSTNTAIGSSVLQSNTTGDSNTAIGYRSLIFNTTGVSNTAVGLGSLYLNTIGIENTSTGRESLRNNTEGNANTATGQRALYLNTTGSNNTAHGYRALYSNTTASNNTANGRDALFSNTTGTNNTATGLGSLYLNTIGTANTANGRDALRSNTTGNNNVANGYQALYSNTEGDQNTANGYQALYLNTTGNFNTANGYQALYTNTTANSNTANGYQSLYLNTTGSQNTATGRGALYSNDTGSSNVANGYASLYSNTEGINNTATGREALYSNTTANSNTANGYQSLYSNTTGSANTANGLQSLFTNTEGDNNTATGYQTLYYNTTGINNTATGYRALRNNTTGVNNAAIGYRALYSNTTGSANTANGLQSLYTNDTGGNNTANGYEALYSNTTGDNNTATGRDALRFNDTGINNTASGKDALRSNTEGTNNAANGYQALFSNTTGDNNTATGYQSLYLNTTGINNTATGLQALDSNTEGNNNTAIGRDALGNNTTGSGNIGIGFRNNTGSYAPVSDPTTQNNRIVLGHTSITNAYVKVAWTVTSDERDKMNFAPVPYGLDFVNQLNPTAYQFKVDRDTETPNGDVRYGFKAQEILELEGENPVIIDVEDPDHLKYKGEHLVPVLVNAVQELTAMVNDLKAEVESLKST